MFQGSDANLKYWNEKTKSKFLDRLKKIGDVYTYQDKTYNINHYVKSNPEHADFDSDIDIDLSYVNPDTHIKMVYDDIQAKYNIEEYKFIPIGWSAGCMLALYFAQLYSEQCIHVILLDSTLWTPNNMKIKLKEHENAGLLYPITNAKYKKLLQDLKENHTNTEDVFKIYIINGYIKALFISQHLKLKLPVPTLSFVNIQEPEGDEWSKDFNNNRRMAEIKILKKHNPDNYTAIIFTNKTHYIFDQIEPAKEIIEQIKSIIPLSLQKTPTRTKTRSKSKSPRSKSKSKSPRSKSKSKSPRSKSKSPRSKSPKSKSSTGGKKKIKTSKKYNKKIISRKIKKKLSF
jgi:hypothetical protein